MGSGHGCYLLIYWRDGERKNWQACSGDSLVRGQKEMGGGGGGGRIDALKNHFFHRYSFGPGWSDKRMKKSWR